MWPAPFPPQERLNEQYEYVGPLGEGGMGATHLCRRRIKGSQTARDVMLVVKVPHVATTGLLPWMRKQVLEEFDALRLLDHANIVKVVDAGFAGAVPFLVLDYLSGETLAARLQSQGPGAAFDMGWLLPVARALDYAHKKGVFHRDVKPSNIIFDDGGNPHVLDFGIAKCVQAGNATASSSSGFCGTYQFCAPEDRRDSARADQYSLAATAYYCLSGQYTHGYDPTRPDAILNLRQNVPATPIVRHVPGLANTTAAALARALSLDRHARFVSCAAFARAFLGLPPDHDDAIPLDERETDGEPASGEPVPIPGFTLQPANAHQPLRSYLHDGTGIEFLFVRGGRFATDQAGEQVRVGPYLLARRPVSWRQWQASHRAMPSQRSTTATPDAPIDRVSWDEANAFCTDHGFTLPTELRWEFACRCGGAVPVGAVAANPWGFEAMLASVHQWCLDTIAADFRAVRGGCRFDPPEHRLATTRNALSPHSNVDLVGFRPAVNVPR